ncbi:MAG: PilZ domain-containing protein [Planctomycetota bacterium]
MKKKAKVAEAERRGSERIPAGHMVSIQIPEISISGPAENISRNGLYLTAGTEIPVEISLDEGGETRKGAIVRVDSIRDGEIGLAIRF